MRVEIVTRSIEHLSKFDVMSRAIQLYFQLPVEFKTSQNNKLNQIKMERVNGIEPSSSGWKPEVITIIRHPRAKDYSKGCSQNQSLKSVSTAFAAIAVYSNFSLSLCRLFSQSLACVHQDSRSVSFGYSLTGLKVCSKQEHGPSSGSSSCHSHSSGTALS